MALHIHIWRLSLLTSTLLCLCLLSRVIAEEPLVQPPSSPSTGPNTPEPESPDLTPAIQLPSLPLSPSQPQPPPPLPPPPSYMTPSVSSFTPTSKPTITATSQSQTTPTSSKSAETPTPKPKEDERPQNRAAIALNLIHVPLKTSCEILRKFYNSSGGVNWSNQDGWQYVDSVRIPTSSPRGQFRGDDGRSMAGAHLRRHDRRSDIKSDKYPPPNNNNDNDDDNDVSPQLPRPPTKKPPPSSPLDHRLGNPGSGPQPPQSPPPYDYDDSDPLQGSLFNPSPTLDPDNCCGWFGVVCIGPDGVVPPPWPPYDEDLVSNRFTVATATSAHPPRLRSRDLPPHLNKRFPPPYYHHDRNPHRGGHGRHGGHGHGTGGEDNRHQPDEDNSENGQYPDESYIDDEEDDGDDYENHGDPRIHEPIKPGPRGHVKDDWYIIEL